MASDWSIKGKVCLVTGANEALGRETVLNLVKMGAERVIMACRNMDTGRTALDYIKLTLDLRKDGDKRLSLRHLDLSSLENIRQFVKTISEEEKQLHLLINNAGTLTLGRERELTVDGFEKCFGTNHVGHFYLTNLLMDLMKESAPSRIVMVSSDFYQATWPWGLNVDDLNFEKVKWFNPAIAYAQSKLANILFTRELDRRLNSTSKGHSGISVFCVHPGVIHTRLTRNQHWAVKWLSAKFIASLPNTCSIKEGAKVTLNCATNPEIEQFSGKYFSQKT